MEHINKQTKDIQTENGRWKPHVYAFPCIIKVKYLESINKPEDTGAAKRLKRKKQTH